MKTCVLICIDHWPWRLHAYYLKKGRCLQETHLCPDHHQGAVWEAIKGELGVKGQVQCWLLWPSFWTDYAHKSWPLPKDKKDRAGILENYLHHDHPEIRGLPMRIQVFHLGPDPIWQLAWPKPEAFRDVMDRLGLPPHQVRLLAYERSALSFPHRQEGDLVDLDPTYGQVLGQITHEGFLAWQRDLDFTTEEGRESFDVLAHRFGAFPQEEGEEGQQGDPQTLVEGVQKTDFFSQANRVRGLRTRARKLPVILAGALGLVLPLVLLGGLALWGQGSQDASGHVQQPAVYQGEAQTPKPSFHHQDVLKMLAAEHHPGIRFSLRASDGLVTQVQGEAETMGDLLALIQTLEEDSRAGGVTLVQAVQGEGGVAFTLAAPHKEASK